MSKVVPKEIFYSLLKDLLGDAEYKRALHIFEEYGVFLSYAVTDVLLYAAEKEKVEEVLSKLEQHLESFLSYHPEISGWDESIAQWINETLEVFSHIRKDVLRIVNQPKKE